MAWRGSGICDFSRNSFRKLHESAENSRKREKDEGRIKAADAAMFATANPSVGGFEV
jgi:hypothetical protein